MFLRLFLLYYVCALFITCSDSLFVKFSLCNKRKLNIINYLYIFLHVFLSKITFLYETFLLYYSHTINT